MGGIQQVFVPLERSHWVGPGEGAAQGPGDEVEPREPAREQLLRKGVWEQGSVNLGVGGHTRELAVPGAGDWANRERDKLTGQAR